MQTILIAIEDPVISMLLSEELFEKGYTIRTISDPWMLSQAVRGNRPELLLIDEFFGAGRGVTLCLRFRKYLRHTTVIIWTSWISALGGMKSRLPENFHIFKTHTLQELAQEIRRRLRRPDEQRTRQNSLVDECLWGP